MPSLKPWTPIGPRRRQRVAEVLFDLAAEAVEAPVVDEILHAGDFAVGPVAEIALHLHDRDAQIDDPRRRRCSTSAARRPGNVFFALGVTPKLPPTSTL